jgi:hypothetical protein
LVEPTILRPAVADPRFRPAGEPPLHHFYRLDPSPERNVLLDRSAIARVSL